MASSPVTVGLVYVGYPYDAWNGSPFKKECLEMFMALMGLCMDELITAESSGISDDKVNKTYV